MFEYDAVILRCIDGDSLEVVIDLGFSIHIQQRVRLLGVDCPEVHGATRMAGVAATKFTQEWLESRKNKVRLRTVLDKEDSFGRVLADVYDREFTGSTLNGALLAAGHAVEMKR